MYVALNPKAVEFLGLPLSTTHVDNKSPYWSSAVILAKGEINDLSSRSDLSEMEQRRAKKEIARKQVDGLLGILREGAVTGYFAKIDLAMDILFFIGLVMERYHEIRPIIASFCGDEAGNLPEKVYRRLAALDERDAAHHSKRTSGQPSRRDGGLHRVGKTARDHRPRSERHPTGRGAIAGPAKGASHKTDPGSKKGKK